MSDSIKFRWKNVLSNIGVFVKFVFFARLEGKSSYFTNLTKHLSFPLVFLKVLPFHFVIYMVEPLILLFL